ncbi:putative membrane protein YphA (DoxX/SURF4 family) [Lipingzhangella halophila]|uniref:Putative membrane protein YphA (DoxX/SURF4 family) n=1 Tax=Lipingzhangella halophila TaxID=1783352 RepID=A0A7W7RMU5_9ACTN|nr:DoxX family protein [Lipingzhangella halophila]MBB4934657.1 putative membrane protein YphA (DoxX/SURF4 family) [Lipingzhangella halophila]
MNQNEAASGQPAAGRGWVSTIALWAAQILLAGYFIALAAIPKLTGSEGALEMFADIGFGQWFRYVTGVVELAGAIGLLIPRLAGLAALGLMCVMVGAALANLFLIPGAASSAVLNVLLGLAFAVIAWARRAEIRQLLAMLGR